MTLHLYNTLSRQKAHFTPIDSKNVRLYVCGVTTYDDPHIGNARPMVVFDVLYRLLRHVYGENHVTYVRNFTDVDDKIIARANETGQTPTQVSQHYMASFHADVDALGCLRPNFEPKVSDPAVMQGIVAFIQALEGKGAAYQLDDGVYLDIAKLDALTDAQETYRYGQLSGKKLDELIAGARVDVKEGKHRSGDFALWKLAKEGEPSWPSPWGAGRPGWHIECSVMSEQLLGKRFDLHGGGEDLQFPHHENELAQSVACHGHIHAGTWLHNAFITVGGKKMSKSLGNFTTIKDALAKYSPEAIRLWLLQTHYRKPVDFSDEALQAIENRLKNLRIKLVQKQSGLIESEAEQLVKISFAKTDSKLIPSEFLEALSDDLNTPRALAVIDQTENVAQVLNMYSMLGIDVFPRKSNIEAMDELHRVSEEELNLLRKRGEARAAKNWPESDRLRNELKAQGILVEDHPDGTTTWRRG